MRIGPTVGLACVLTALHAQTPPDPVFEVASVKPAASPSLPGGRIVAPMIIGGPGTKDPQRISYNLFPLSSLIATAWELRADQIMAPGWLNTERYDIAANVPPGATPAQVHLMLQSLLRERFHLRFHTEAKDRAVYALRPGKNGPKLQPWIAKDTPDPAGPMGLPDNQCYPVLPASFKGALARPLNGQLMIRGQGATIAQLITWLDAPAGRPVVDETGLTGLYDFRIHFEQRRVAANPDSPSDPAPTVFDAIESQLGLRLESGKRSYDNFIVDSVDREPTPN